MDRLNQAVAEGPTLIVLDLYLEGIAEKDLPALPRHLAPLPRDMTYYGGLQVLYRMRQRNLSDKVPVLLRSRFTPGLALDDYPNLEQIFRISEADTVIKQKNQASYIKTLQEVSLRLWPDRFPSLLEPSEYKWLGQVPLNRPGRLHRMSLYNEALKHLQDNELVYACNCSRKQLSENTCNCYEKQLPLTADNVSWRLITTPSNRLIIKNYNGELMPAVLPTEMENFVVRKKDGFPAYQLTSVIDDLYYGVDLIVRGQDLWHSTLAQHQLATALGKDDFKNITFYHHPLIKDSAGNKLSKSAGATSIKYLREQGKSTGDVYQLIAMIISVNDPVHNWSS